MSNEPQGFLHSIRSPFFVVVVLLAAMFVAGPFVERLETIGPVLLTGTLGFALLLGIVGSKPSRLTVRLGIGAALLIVVSTALSSHERRDLWGAVTYVGLVLLTMTALVTVLRTVLLARSVRAEEIFAAIAAYLLLGFFWAFLYAVFEGQTEDAFRGLDAVPRDEMVSTLIYYSFVTLTTLGYGEIVPTNSFTQNLAVFEAVTGQLFIAVLLARLVALGTMNAISSSNRPD